MCILPDGYGCLSSSTSEGNCIIRHDRERILCSNRACSATAVADTLRGHEQLPYAPQPHDISNIVQTCRKGLRMQVRILCVLPQLRLRNPAVSDKIRWNHVEPLNIAPCMKFLWTFLHA